jgi:hypothetical protein
MAAMRGCCGETVRGCRTKASGSGGISPDPARSLSKTGAGTMLSFEPIPRGAGSLSLRIIWTTNVC